jgi:RNA polymerase sigma factor (sigma-70 family)
MKQIQIESRRWGNLTNKAYLEGIKTENRDILRSIYDEFQGNIIKYICSNGGTVEEAKDVFSEAVVVVFRKVKAGELILDSPFSAYLLAICKNLWLKYYRQKKWSVRVTKNMERVFPDEDPLPDEQVEATIRNRIIREIFTQLTEDCQRIIQMRWDGQSYDAIREVLGHKSEGYSRKRKHICYERLEELIRKDERLKEFYQ